MKQIAYAILFFLTSAATFAQTSLDSLVLKKANEYRDSLCLPKLEFSKVCYAAADSQASYLMKDLRIISHSQKDPQSADVGKRYQKALGTKEGSYTWIGEIVAACSRNVKEGDKMAEDKIAADLISQWKNSKEHRAILTDPKAKYAGVSTKYEIENTGIKKFARYQIRSVMVLSTYR